MFRKVAIAGATAAVIIGADTAALAESGSTSSGTPSSSSTSSSSSSSSNSAGKDLKLRRFAKKHPGIAALLSHHAVHGQIVTTDSKGNYVTHDGILGTVTAVSPTSISIKSGDNFTQTYTINSTTHVRVRTDGKDSSISEVHVGAKVGVVGVLASGSTTPVATYVVAQA